MAKLRGLAYHWLFGQFLDDSLRGKFVCGLLSLKIQQRLVQTDKLTLKAVANISQPIEYTGINAKDLHEWFTSKVHKVENSRQHTHSQAKEKSEQGQERGSHNNTRQCYRCGYTNHTAHKCKYKEYVCNECHKKGHLAKVWKSKGNKHQTTKQIVYEGEGNALILYHDEFNVKVVKMETDTGSGVTIMPEFIFLEKFKGEVELKTTLQILKTYNGSQIPLMGEATVKVKGKDGQAKQVRLLAAQVLHQSLVMA